MPPHGRPRLGLRYPSDLTDPEWALIAPMIPRPATHGRRKRSVDVREVLNGIFQVLSTGCQWNALPKDLPPKSTVCDYFNLWEWDSTLERIHHKRVVAGIADEGGAKPRDLALGDAGPGHRLYQLVHRADRDALDVSFPDDRDQRILARLSQLEEGREVASLAQLGDL